MAKDEFRGSTSSKKKTTKLSRKRIRSTNLDEWFDCNLDIKSRTIYLGGANFDSEGGDAGVEALMAEFAIKGLHTLDKTRGVIRAYLNSIGGDECHGLAIYDAIKACHSPVDIIVYGQAMSMGAWILQAGRNRIMRPNSTLMIHDGSTNVHEGFSARDAERWVDFEKYTRQKMYEAFAERSGRSVSYWKRLCANDTIMSAERAVRLGLADKILVR